MRMTSVRDWINRLEGDRRADSPHRERRVPGGRSAWTSGAADLLNDLAEDSGVFLPAEADDFGRPEGDRTRGGHLPAALLARVQGRAGIVLFQAEDLPSAADAFESAIRLHREAGPQGFGPDLAACWNGLALIHQSLERVADAPACYEEALRILELHDRAFSTDAGIIHNNLGCLHHMDGRFTDAVESHQRALDMRWRLCPGDHAALAEAERNLALSALGAGDGDTALLNFHRALRRCDGLGEGWRTKSVEILLCLAKLHDQRGEFGDAEMVLIEAFNRHESGSGAPDALKAILLNGLGCIYAKGGYLKEARRMFQKALDLQKSGLIRNLMDLAISYANLGVIDYELGGVRQAEVFFQRASNYFAEAQTSAAGPGHVAHLQQSLRDAAASQVFPSLVSRLLGSPETYAPLEPAMLLIHGTAP